MRKVAANHAFVRYAVVRPDDDLAAEPQDDAVNERWQQISRLYDAALEHVLAGTR